MIFKNKRKRVLELNIRSMEITLKMRSPMQMRGRATLRSERTKRWRKWSRSNKNPHRKRRLNLNPLENLPLKSPPLLRNHLLEVPESRLPQGDRPGQVGKRACPRGSSWRRRVPWERRTRRRRKKKRKWK